MDNQHKQIKGYRDLSQAEIDAMNEVKFLSEKVGELTTTLKNNPSVPVDQRWLSIAVTDLQKGFMALVRSIAQPTTF